jgi:cell division protease FtsH
MTSEFALGQIAILMGGRVAEELVYNQKTTGAGNDIERATELARAMVTEWGMSEEFGPLNFAGGGKQEVFLGRDFSSNERHSEDTAKRIDAEIRRIVVAQHERAVAILTAHRPELEAVAQALLEYETLDGEDISVLLKGERLSRPVPASAKKKIELSTEGTDNKKRPNLIPATPEPA